MRSLTDICVPHTHVREATFLSLLQYYNTPEFPVCWNDVGGSGWAYNHYLSDRWYAGKTFINLEHDVVVWPGAMENLMSCPHPWCFFGYHPSIRMTDNGGAPFGCVKFTDVIILGTKDVWKRQREDEAIKTSDQPWRTQDLWFYQEASKAGFQAHQHWPSVLNCSPPADMHMDWTVEGVLHCPRPSIPNPLSDAAFTSS